MKKISKIRSRISSSTRVITRNHWAFLAISAIGTTCLAALISLLPPVHKILTSVVHEGTVQGPAYILGNILLGYFLLLLGGSLFYIWRDYRQHLRPLKQEMPTIVYTPVHYVKVVFFPRAKHSWKQTLAALSRVAAGSFVILATFIAGFALFVSAAPGSLTVTINQKSGTADPNPSYTSVFTVQFSEAIDRATFTSADITLGGTAPSQSVQSITEAGSFNKTTYEVRIQATGAGTITPTIGQELITAQNGDSGTNQASTSTDNSVTYNGNYAPNEFVTTWKTNNPGGTGSNQIRVPTFGGGYNYTVNWGDGNTSTGQTGNATHTYASAGTYTVKISGTFPRIYFYGSDDKQKVMTIEQWGTTAWSSVEYALGEAVNLTIPAYDGPNLSAVTSTYSMFYGASSFNQNIGHWDISSITSMNSMFIGAKSYNQPLNDWDVSSVTNMSGMFGTFLQNDSNTMAFNQPLNDWDVSSVTNMSGMFYNSHFNQPLNSWDVSHVTNMSGMFILTKDFNQPLNDWDVSSVTNMANMFSVAISFNQPLSNWDVSHVTDMRWMFQDARVFNQPLNDWDVSSVTSMDGMFVNFKAPSFSAFNQPLNDWDVSHVTNMHEMFRGTTLFNQSLASWQVTSVTNMIDMFSGGSGLSVSNYDATLTGWSVESLQNNVTFGAGTSKYCNAITQRQSIITNFNWTINDSGQDCTPPPNPDAFITTWDTGNGYVSNVLAIPTYPGEPYNYTINWGDGSSDTSQTGNASHEYASAGVYTVTITGTFSGLYCDGDSNSAAQLMSVDQWGSSQWMSMEGAFKRASHVNFSAIDSPDITQVTTMSGAFENATAFNSSLNDWDVSNVVDMSNMFTGASSFNQPLNNWDVSNVIDMSDMFAFASSFNQSLDSWGVSSVVDMYGMFTQARQFNQPLNSWDVSSVTDMMQMFSFANSFNQPLNTWQTQNVTIMHNMFLGAIAFNQPLNNWDVSNITNMNGMFAGATSFDQSLAQWNVGNVATMNGFFANYAEGMVEYYLVVNHSGALLEELTQEQKDAIFEIISIGLGYTVTEENYQSFGSGLSTPNYDATLISWSQQPLQSTVTFDAGTSKYCTSEVQRQSIIDTFTWTINDDGKNCTVPIGIPQNLSGVPHATSIELNWDDVVNADYYVVQYKKTSDSSWTEYTNNTVTGSYLEITGLNPSTSYDFRVKAVDSSSNESDWSDILTMSTLAQQTYHITDCEQLQAIMVNPITFEFGDGTAHYMLDNDIDCSETSTWTWDGLVPPGSGVVGFLGFMDIMHGQPFSGIVDGQGHTVSNIYQNANVMTYDGLISYGDGATLKNITLDHSTISQTSQSAYGSPYGMGGAVSTASNMTIQNVHVTNLSMNILDSVMGTGGLVGLSMNGGVTVENSSSQGSITINPLTTPFFTNLGGIAVDTSGNIYVSDSGNGLARIQKFDANGGFITQWKIGDDDSCRVRPKIAIDASDNIYVTCGNYDNNGDNHIEKFDSDGNFISRFGSTGSGDGEFSGPSGIAVDKNGSIYVADTNNNRIQKFDSSGNFISKWGDYGSDNGQFQYPQGITIDSSDNIYVSSSSGSRIQKFDSSGNYLAQFSLSDPTYGIAVDQSGDIYASYFGSVQKFDNTGNYLSQVGSPGHDNGQFSGAGSLTVDSTGNLYVADTNYHRIQKFDSSGNYLSQFGSEAHYPIINSRLLGGLVGGADPMADSGASVAITRSFSDVAITYMPSPVLMPKMIMAGGIIGSGYPATISNSYSHSPIHINGNGILHGNPHALGGVSGFLLGSITNSYSSGDVVVENYHTTNSLNGASFYSMTGGIAGFWYDFLPNGSGTIAADITNVFAVGAVSTPDTGYGYFTGGLVGFAPESSPGGHVTNSYYDKTLTGQEQCVQGYYDTEPAGTTCTPINTDGTQASYFKNNHTNPPLDQWNFSSIWKTTCDYPDFTGQTCGESPQPDPTDFSLNLSLATAGPIKSGQTVTYHFKITNEGPNDSYYMGLIMGVAPLEFTFGSNTNSGVVCSDAGPANELSNQGDYDFGAKYGARHMFGCQPTGIDFNNFTTEDAIPLGVGQSIEFDIVGIANADFINNVSASHALYFDFTESDFLTQYNDALNNNQDPFTIQANNVSSVLYIYSSLPPPNPTAPSVPRNPSVSNRTTSSLRFNWSPPASNGGSPLTGYQVQYKKASSPTWVSVPVLGPSVTSRVFTGLSANTAYHFRVLASNAVGSSPYTSPITGTTLAPGKPPTSQPPTNSPTTPSTTAPSGSGGSPTPGLAPLAVADTLPGGQVKGSWWNRLSDSSLNLIAWLLAALLLLLGSIYGYQAYREYAQQKAAAALAKRLQAVKDSVTNYANTAIHYLNTPAAVMKGSLELAASLKQVPQGTLDLLQNRLAHFTQTGNQLGVAVEGDARDLTQAASVVPVQTSQLWPKLAIWGPVGVMVLCFGLLQVLLINRSAPNQTLQTSIQVVCFLAGVGLVIGGNRLQTARTALKAQAQQAIAMNQASLLQRQTFLEVAARQLSKEHEDLKLASTHLPASPALKTFQNGLAMLSGVTHSLVNVKVMSTLSADAPLIDINALLGRLDSGLQAAAQKQDVTLTTHVPADLAVRLQPEEADQLLGSVIQNAIKFSKPGNTVTVSARTLRNKVSITVQDQGIGISPEQQAHIFEPFSRATSSEQFDYEGLGINMYTNRLLLDKLGGEIAVESGSTGTKVTIELPIPKSGSGASPQLITPNTQASGAAIVGGI